MADQCNPTLQAAADTENILTKALQLRGRHPGFLMVKMLPEGLPHRRRKENCPSDVGQWLLSPFIRHSDFEHCFGTLGVWDVRGEAVLLERLG